MMLQQGHGRSGNGYLHMEVPQWVAQPVLDRLIHVPIRNGRVPVVCLPEALLLQLWPQLWGRVVGARSQLSCAQVQ